jgi:hypothetical protein
MQASSHAYALEPHFRLFPLTLTAERWRDLLSSWCEVRPIVTALMLVLKCTVNDFHHFPNQTSASTGF